MTKDELFEDIGEIIGQSEEEFGDRTVRELWPLVVDFVADWIQRMAKVAGYEAGEFWLEAAWRAEMDQ